MAGCVCGDFGRERDVTFAIPNVTIYNMKKRIVFDDDEAVKSTEIVKRKKTFYKDRNDRQFRRGPCKSPKDRGLKRKRSVSERSLAVEDDPRQVSSVDWSEREDFGSIGQPVCRMHDVTPYFPAQVNSVKHN